MRKPNTIRPRRSYFIAVEGRQTERHYFERIKEVFSLDKRFNCGITLYPQVNEEEARSSAHRHSFRTDPMGLVNIAAQKTDFDERWVVFDQDLHPALEKAFEEALKHGIRVAFSCRAFETWILLHFEKNHRYFQQVECKDPQNRKKNCRCGMADAHPMDCRGRTCIAGYLRTHFLPRYGKDHPSAVETSKKLVTRSLEFVETAMQNAAWLRAETLHPEHRRLLGAQTAFTDVDLLVAQLLGPLLGHEAYFWTEPGKTAALPEYSLKIERPDIGSALQVLLEWKEKRGLVFNVHNLEEHFTAFGADGQNVPLHLSKTIQVRDGETARFELAPERDSKPVLLCSKLTNNHILVSLR